MIQLYDYQEQYIAEIKKHFAKIIININTKYICKGKS